MVPARFIDSRFARWLSRGWRRLPWAGVGKRPVDPRHALGERGERLAARCLRQRGYRVLYRNFRARGGGEVDLVCRHRDVLVFVEVKTRSSVAYGRPVEAVDAPKQRLIARGALAWLKMLHNPEILFRFDIVEVLVDPRGVNRPACEILENAFTLPEPYLYPGRKAKRRRRAA